MEQEGWAYIDGRTVGRPIAPGVSSRQPPSGRPLTRVTATGDRLATVSATLPRTIRAGSERPWLPITI